MNRSVAFQFYPDKWQSHTRRLTDSAYRVYHELLCWMWQQASDQCSIEASHEAVSCAVCMPIQYVKDAFADIQNAYAPLLRTDAGRWVSNGLRKEVEKQTARRAQCQKAADAHHKAADARKKAADAPIEHNTPSPSPTPLRTTISETESPSSETHPPVQDELPKTSRVIGAFPCDGNPTEWKYTQDYHDYLCKMYQTLDVMAEVKKARIWIDANMEKRKTAKGMKRFLANWMNRAVNK